MVAESKQRDPAGQLGSRPINDTQRMGTPIKSDDSHISANFNSFEFKSEPFQREDNSLGNGSVKETRTRFPSATLRAQTYRSSMRGGSVGTSPDQ